MSRRQLPYLIGGVAAGLLVLAVILVLVLGGGGRKYERCFSEAEAAFLRKDYDAALEQAGKAMRFDDGKDECYLLLADIYRAQGDTDTALQVLLLGYSRTGSEAVSRMLEELRTEVLPTPTPTPAAPETSVMIGGMRIAIDATSAILSKLSLSDADILPLASLRSLSELSLSDNHISDLAPLSALDQLTSLQLNNNRVSDLSPLASLTSLRTLYIDGNPVTDFSALNGLTALRTLSMKNIAVTDTQIQALKSALPNCHIYSDEPTTEFPEITLGGRTFRTDVTELNLGGLELTDISALAACSELVELDLRDNHISDISALVSLPKLQRLSLWNNEVTSLVPLLGLQELRYLDLDTNRITDISVLSRLTGLEELWLNNNAITDFTPLRGLTNLTRLGLKNVGLTDDALDALTGLTALTELTVEGNEGLGQEKFDELREALPKCAIAHSELVPAPSPEPTEEPEPTDFPEPTEEPTESPEPTEAPAPTEEPDPAYRSAGEKAALDAAGTGSGYAIVSRPDDAASAGIRSGFLAQAGKLTMNTVADETFSDMAADAAALVAALQAAGADVVIVAADDGDLAALIAAAGAASYRPTFVQVY